MITHVFKGITAYFGTIGLISKLRLWKYFAIPVLISIFTAGVVILSAFTFADDIANLISNLWIWDWGKSSFFTVSRLFSALAIILLGFITYKHIVMALSAPFMGPVSEKIENYLTGSLQKHTSSFTAQLWRGIRINVRNLIKELVWTIPVLILGVIPVIGIFSTIIILLIQAYFAGFGNMDYTLERHLNYQESIKFVKQNKGIAIGNGIIFILFLMIPIVGLILVLPLSVTAATTETVKLLKQQNRLIISDL